MYTAANGNETLSTANDALKNFTQIDDFQSSMVVVITWDRVRQGRYRLVNFNPNQVRRILIVPLKTSLHCSQLSPCLSKSTRSQWNSQVYLQTGFVFWPIVAPPKHAFA